jgi:hypothetical protein
VEGLLKTNGIFLWVARGPAPTKWGRATRTQRGNTRTLGSEGCATRMNESEEKK